jgi:heptosyltransferase I
MSFIIFDKSQRWAAYRNLRKNLHGLEFEVLLHMQSSLRASIASTCIKALVKLGFDRARARDYQWLFTTHKIAPNPHQHVMDGFFGFLEHLGLRERTLRWDIPIPDQAKLFAERNLPSATPVLVINPCSSVRWKNWHVEGYAALSDYAAQRYQMHVVLTGGPSQVEMHFGAHILERCTIKPLNLIGGTTLKELLAVLQRASALIAPDTGPVHMATAVGIPVIGLYATSNPLRTGPYLSQQWVVNKYPDSLKAESRLSVEEATWGKRVRNLQAMNRISISDVTEKLDMLMRSLSG